MKKRFFLATAVMISSHLLAQRDSSKNLDELVVTATRTSVKQSQTGKVVTVIDQATLQQNIDKSLPEILNYQAGVYIVGANNVLGSNQENYLRGSASGNTLILIDGIPVGDPSMINSSFDLASINPEQVERIEILKGAQSTLWGSDAVAGVINIITKKPGTAKITPVASLSYGSYRTVRAGAGVNGKTGNFSYNVHYNHTSSQGFSAAHDSTGSAAFDKDGFNQNNVQASLGYNLSKTLSVNAVSSFGRYSTELDAGAFLDDKDFSGNNTNLLNSLAILYRSGKLQLDLTNSLVNARRMLDDDSSDIGGFTKFARGVYKGKSFVSELHGSYAFSSLLSLTAGAQRIFYNTDQSYLSISDFGSYQADLAHEAAKTTNYSAYASLLLIDFHGFNAEAGLRYNNHSRYGNNATYSFNPSFNISRNLRVFVNISSAYKVPSLYQLYSEYGNTGLRPEQSNNIEGGFQWVSKDQSSSVRMVAFKRNIRQLIIFYTDPITYMGKYINRDRQNDYGFELESTLQLGKFARWVNNITYVNGKGIVAEQHIQNFYRRPNFTLNSILNLTPVKAVIISPSLRIVGNRLKGEFDAGPQKMPSYYTVDLYGSYAISAQLRAFADLRNVTNQLYFDVPGYNSRRFNMVAGLNFSW